MKKSDRLFDLIHSMSMSEKRYFKLFATKTHDNNKTNYIYLFDIIEKQKKYKEADLIEKLQRQGIKTTFLSADKNYLYGLILKSLSAFNAGKSIKLTIKENLEYVEILYYKGLHQQALKLLNKVKKLALQHDLQIEAIDIMMWERNISGYDLQPAKIKKGFDELNQQMALLLNTNQYAALYYESMMLRKMENKARDKQSIAKFDVLLQHDLLQNYELAQSKAAKILYNDTYANYYYLTNNESKEYLCNKNILELIEGDTKYMKEKLVDYILVYSRLLRLQRRQDPEKFKMNLQKFKNIPTKFAKTKIEIRTLVDVLSYSIEMVDAINRGAFEEACLLIKTVEEYFKMHEGHIRPEFIVTAYYRFIYIYIALKKYTEALNYANKIINEFDESIRPDIYSFTRILHLLIHYELNNFYLLKYLIRSTNQYLKKQKRLHKIEHTFLKFMQKSLNLVHKKEVRMALDQLYSDITAVAKESDFEKRALYYFDFLTWLESKLSGTTFAAIQKEKYQKSLL